MRTGVDHSPALEAIVLAAGSARRFGGGKLRAPYRGGALLDGALAAAFAAPVRSVTVVSGADEAVEVVARAFAERTGSAARLRLVRAADHAQGMAASLRAGVASLPLDADGVFIFLGDMPRVPHAVLDGLAAEVRAGAPAAAPTFDGRRGNPALLGAALIPQLLGLKGDAGARAILQALGPRLALVEAPGDGVLFDVDERGDLDAS